MNGDGDGDDVDIVQEKRENLSMGLDGVMEETRIGVKVGY